MTYWVNSSKAPCVGVGPMECLQVRRSESGPWELFYSQIDGFSYEAGYIYKLKVQEEILDPATVPADASSIRYTLVSVEEKTPDP